jgi:L-ascorbate metabolism protein UlaG (beta-lactamase superfamily)
MSPACRRKKASEIARVGNRTQRCGQGGFVAGMEDVSGRISVGPQKRELLQKDHCRPGGTSFCLRSAPSPCRRRSPAMTFVFVSLAMAVVFILISCGFSARPFDERKWREKVNTTNPALLYAPHYRDGRYFNPWMPLEKEFGDLLAWWLSERTAYSPEEEKAVPRVIPGLPERIAATVGDFIAWIGHATYLIRVDGVYWLTDPMFSERALLPKRRTPPALTLKDFIALPGEKNVIISHNHYDHLDADSIRGLPPETRIFVPLGLKAVINEMGGSNVVEMDWWQEAACGSACRLICLPAQHWSRRTLTDTNTSLWAGFLLETSGRRIFFGGDSGYFLGFREIGRRYPGIDYALIPVTAYAPRWFMHYAHMDAREALAAFQDLGARYFIPTQWGTFRLGDEPIAHAPRALAVAREEAGIVPERLLIMDIGQLLPLK